MMQSHGHVWSSLVIGGNLIMPQFEIRNGYETAPFLHHFCLAFPNITGFQSANTPPYDRVQTRKNLFNDLK